MSERLQLPPCLPGSRHKSGSYLVPQCREFLFPLGFALRMGDAHPVRKYPAHQVFVYQRPQHPQGGQRETFWQRQLDFVGFRLFQYIVQCFLFVRYLLFRVRVQHFHAFGMPCSAPLSHGPHSLPARCRTLGAVGIRHPPEGCLPPQTSSYSYRRLARLA